jgi:hypothetical protein
VAKPNRSALLESWNLRGSPLQVPLAHSSDLVETTPSIAFSPGGALLIGAHGEGQLSTWDLATGFELHPAKLPYAKITPQSLLSADGSTALPPSSEDFTHADAAGQLAVTVTSTQKGTPRGTVREFAGSAFRTISRDGARVATVTAKVANQWTISVWDLSGATARAACTLKVDAEPLIGVFSPDNASLAVGLGNGQTVLASASSGSSKILGQASYAVSSLCFVHGELFCGHRDGTLEFWSSDPSKNHLIAAHQGAVGAIVAADGGDWVFSAGIDHKLRIWTRELQPIRTIDMNPQLDLLAISPAGGCLVFRAGDGLRAVHLDFARRLMEANTGAWNEEQLARRYFALGRPDWMFEILPKATPWMSPAELARAFWQAGKMPEARNAFGEAVKQSPDDADLKACLAGM